jgi:hypothetical protein
VKWWTNVSSMVLIGRSNPSLLLWNIANTPFKHPQDLFLLFMHTFQKCAQDRCRVFSSPNCRLICDVQYFYKRLQRLRPRPLSVDILSSTVILWYELNWWLSNDSIVPHNDYQLWTNIQCTQINWDHSATNKKYTKQSSVFKLHI